MSLEGQKVIAASEMARVERASIEAGASDDAYMQQAGASIAECVKDFIAHHHLSDPITLLVGKGNNGGDAFVVGCQLLEDNCTVHAMACFKKEECSPLCQKYWQRFLELGGVVIDEMPTEGVLVDGLLGTGFTGSVVEPIAPLIDAANKSGLPIVAIDIPSGLDGNTGEVNGPCISADLTCYLGMPKVGFFLSEGMNYIGDLAKCDFGLDANYAENAKAEGFLLNEEKLPELLPIIKRTRHKYQAGYLLALAGSPGMPGAAMMASLAAYRAGAGIIRLFHPSGMEDEFAAGPKELVRSAWDQGLAAEEMKRAGAALVGPGIGRSENAGQMFDAFLELMQVPAVIDADGLYWLSKKKRVFTQPVILTPHAKEMQMLLGSDVTCSTCQKYADETNATVVLKGAPSWIFHPKSPALIMDRGCPGLATAGTGDVLAGILSGLLVQKMGAREAAAIGTWLHGLCGELVSLDKTDYGMIASDLIDALPEVWSEILSN